LRKIASQHRLLPHGEGRHQQRNDSEEHRNQAADRETLDPAASLDAAFFVAAVVVRGPRRSARRGNRQLIHLERLIRRESMPR
jgi:hypothetical protein